MTAISPRFLTLWAINAPLNERRLARQLDQMKSLGFDGAVFHPRFYPNDPPYLSPEYLRIVSRTILHARDRGMAFWIYDENGWPSGVADGKVLRENPDHGGAWLSIERQADPTNPPLLQVHVDAQHRVTNAPAPDGQTYCLTLRRSSSAIDYLSPEPCRRFLSMTLDAYRDGLEPAAWEHVEAIFTDEPEFGLGHAFDHLSPDGAIPWTPRLPEIYRQRLGRDILLDLPLIVARGPDHESTRARFWEFLTDLMIDGFFQPYHDWCERHGKLFTGHLKGDEHPLFQVMMNGSCHRAFRAMHMPGIDPLERDPINHYFARQAASAAAQFGNGRTLAEAMGGAGWGASPQDVQRYFTWLTRHGVTDLAIHLWQYRLSSHAIRDWPPSHPNHLRWNEAYPALLQRIKDSLRDSPPAAPDTLVVAPYRAIMRSIEPWEVVRINIHNASTYPDTAAGRINDRFMARVQKLHESGVACHFTDERTLEELGRVEADCVTLGRQSYRSLMIDEACAWQAEGVTLLKLARERGLIVVEPRPAVPRQAATSDAPIAAEFTPIWRSTQQRRNAMLLQARTTESITHELAWSGVAGGDLTLRLADVASSVIVNDQSLPCHPDEEGSRVTIPAALQRLENHVVLSFSEPLRLPFAWLEGFFEARSLTPFVPGPRDTIKTLGPWRIVPADAPVVDRFVESGYAFADQPAIVQTPVVLPRLAHGIELAGIHADAVRVDIDGAALGWAWGPDWRLNFPAALAAGPHMLTLELVPSTFNYFGPHRHITGDPPITSPDQLLGVRNFADPIGTPAMTTGDAWHFRRLNPPRKIRFLSRPGSSAPSEERH